jgi:hypothetical protein
MSLVAQLGIKAVTVVDVVLVTVVVTVVAATVVVVVVVAVRVVVVVDGITVAIVLCGMVAVTVVVGPKGEAVTVAITAVLLVGSSRVELKTMSSGSTLSLATALLDLVLLDGTKYTNKSYVVARSRGSCSNTTSY